jgi:hypothetical protein
VWKARSASARWFFSRSLRGDLLWDGVAGASGAIGEPLIAELLERGQRKPKATRFRAVDPATRVPYFPTMCEASFSFSMQIYSISSVPVTNCQVTFTVQGLV